VSDKQRKALLGKKFDKERIEKMRLSNILRKDVIVTNTETREILEFSSMTDCAPRGKYLGMSRVSVKKYLLNNIAYKQYTISVKGPFLTNKEDITEASSLAFGTRTSLNNAKTSPQAILLTNKKTGDIKNFATLTEAAEYLDISRGRLWYFFCKIVKTGDETLKGYTISKIQKDPQDIVNRNTRKLEVTDIDTNEVTIYPSLTLAGEALGIRQSSISKYLAEKRSNPFRKKYIFKLI
jgi:hypothetical protein